MKKKFNMDRGLSENEISSLIAFFQTCFSLYFEETQKIIQIMSAAGVPYEFGSIIEIIDKADAVALSAIDKI